jgi:hypothetical protein
MSLLSATLKNFTHTRLDEPPVRLRKYPHLINPEARLWDAFLAQNPTFFDGVSYDVHVGEGQTDPKEKDPKYIQLAKLLTQRRIDVLAERRKQIWIVEVKFDPGVTLLGQLIAYKTLVLHKLKTPIPLDLCAIVNRLDPDLTRVLKTHSISYFIITPTT